MEIAARRIAMWVSGLEGEAKGSSPVILTNASNFGGGDKGNELVCVVSGGVDRPPRSGRATRRVWGNVPPRNPGFTGRDSVLSALRTNLLSGDRSATQVIYGIGGVGKTQLAAEYAHRFAGGYDVTWWIHAEQVGLIGEQFAELGEALGCSALNSNIDIARQAVLMTLHAQSRWLLVFDNAVVPEDLSKWLPGGAGHVLITSRHHRWTDIASPMEIGVLTRPESVLLARKRLPSISSPDARKLAGSMGDLPLAIVQATSYMHEGTVSAVQYIEMLKSKTLDLMKEGIPSSYGQSLTSVTLLEVDRLQRQSSAAADLASVRAFLAPEGVPIDWFIRAAPALPVSLTHAAGDPLAWARVIRDLGRSALVRIDGDALLMHRITQKIICEALPPRVAAAARVIAEKVVISCHPGDIEVPANWRNWALLLPHFLALNPEMSLNLSLRGMACEAARHLIVRGDARAGYDLAETLRREWQGQSGADDATVLMAGRCISLALKEMGEPEAALRVAEDNYDRSRRIFGEANLDTLAAAHELAACLHRRGYFERGRKLDEATYTRRLRILGEDHPRTLESASSLAVQIKELHDYDAACKLEQETLAARRRVLGDKHPRTLESASNLGVTLSRMGNSRVARKLDEEVLAGFREIYGKNHHRTLTQAINLAEDYRDAEENKAALDIDQDALPRLRKLLGKDHFITLVAANNLAVDLRRSGDVEGAKALDEDTLARRRKVLPEKHPDILVSENNLATDMRLLREKERGRADPAELLCG
jgi:tetratricopeptide (TPR) repeat protein